MSLAAVRAGIKATLDTIDDLNVYGYLTTHPSLAPAAVVVGFPDTLDPHAVLGTGADYRIDLALYVGLAEEQAADEILTARLESIITALDDDPTLGGACSSATVLAAADFGRIEIGAGEAFGCLITVEVYG